MRGSRLALLSILLFGACGGGGGTHLPMPDTCNPLGVNHCMTPWPSSVFEVDDATTRPAAASRSSDALPTNVDGDHDRSDVWNLADGFSPPRRW